MARKASVKSLDQIKHEHLFKRLDVAAKRPNPKPIGKGVDADYLFRLGTKQKWKCAVSGIELQFTKGKGGQNPFVCSIDRIDSEKGYLKGNCQLTIWIVNQCKGKWSQNEFVNMAKAVSENMKGR